MSLWLDIGLKIVGGGSLIIKMLSTIVDFLFSASVKG
jgi:hypothetical protein